MSVLAMLELIDGPRRCAKPFRRSQGSSRGCHLLEEVTGALCGRARQTTNAASTAQTRDARFAEERASRLTPSWLLQIVLCERPALDDRKRPQSRIVLGDGHAFPLREASPAQYL
jgi:hypothetical protein